MIARLNLLLLLAVLASALYLVHIQYQSRRLFTELDRARAQAQELETEHRRLLVEKRAQATPLRIEQMARAQLGMRAATPAITQYLQDSPAPTGAAGASVQAGANDGTAPTDIGAAHAAGAMHARGTVQSPAAAQPAARARPQAAQPKARP